MTCSEDREQRYQFKTNKEKTAMYGSYLQIQELGKLLLIYQQVVNAVTRIFKIKSLVNIGSSKLWKIQAWAAMISGLFGNASIQREQRAIYGSFPQNARYEKKINMILIKLLMFLLDSYSIRCRN